MKMHLMLGLGILAGFSACKKADSVVVVNVSINADVSSIYSLRVAMSTAQAHDSKVYPTTPSATAIPSSASFAIVLPRSRTGRLDLAVDGVGTSEKIVAHGTAQTDIIAGGTATVSIIVAAGAPPCGNGVVDPGETCDDGNQFSFDGCDFRCQTESASLDAGFHDTATYETEEVADVQDSKADVGIADATYTADAAQDIKGPGQADGWNPDDASQLGQADTGTDADPVSAQDSDARLLDATGGYTTSGVTAYLGVNPCYTAYDRAHAPTTNDAMGGGWDPATNTCYTPTWPIMSGICGTKPACGTYEPGTLLVWDANDLRYRYLGDVSGGIVCLPNDTPYVVPCS